MTDADQERIRELENLVYVPGLRKCAKCKCVLVSNFLHTQNGMISANNKPQQCPNDCGPIWPVTERESGNEMAERLTAFLRIWQPIETAPKDGSVILVRHNRGTWIYPKDQEKINYVVVFWNKGRFEEFGPDSFPESDLTHWMPLPEPPK